MDIHPSEKKVAVIPPPAVACVKDVRSYGDCTLVVLCGEIDIHTAPDINRRLDPITHVGDADLLIDLCSVDFMDGTGVRLLERARSHSGRLRLICTSPALLHLLNLPWLRLGFDILDRLPVPEPPRVVA